MESAGVENEGVDSRVLRIATDELSR